MQSILYIILIIVFVAIFTHFGPGLTNEQKGLQQASLSPIPEQEESQPEANAKAQENTIQEQPATKQTFIKTSGPSPVLIDTYITSGPKEGEIIEETTNITFEFEAKIYSEQTNERVLFETNLQGLDEGWLSTLSKSRTISFPPGQKEYTFWVRATTKDSVDPTPAGRTFKINVSPYFEKVKISSINQETSFQPSLITLSSNIRNDEQINVTDWHIEGTRGKVIISQGVEKYYHFYGSYVNEDIFVKRGDRVYLSGSFNPLGRDRNFRLNKCMGYLSDDFDFPVSLPQNCPGPKSEEISHLDPCCQEFIFRLRGCEIPDYSDDSVISLGSECISYLNENFNNMGCFKNYSENEDFLENTWYIFLNKDIVVSYGCDTLYLRDQNGFLVDKYSYGRAVCR